MLLILNFYLETWKQNRMGRFIKNVGRWDLLLFHTLTNKHTIHAYWSSPNGSEWEGLLWEYFFLREPQCWQRKSTEMISKELSSWVFDGKCPRVSLTSLSLCSWLISLSTMTSAQKLKGDLEARVFSGNMRPFTEQNSPGNVKVL